MEVIGLSGPPEGEGIKELGIRIINNLRRRTGILKGLIDDDYSSLVTDDAKIMRAESPGVSPYLESSAEKVILLCSSPGNLKSAVDEAMSYFEDLDYLFVIGNDLILSLNPGVLIHVEENEGETEKSKMVKKDADAIINYVELHKSSRLRDIDVDLPGEEISCYRAQLISDLLGWGYAEFGSKLDREEIRVRRCQLNLFD